MDWATHEYLHRTRGAAIANGFTIGNYTTTGGGNLITDLQFSIANGTFFDEDLQVDITNGITGSGVWVQPLDPIANIPVIYKEGAGSIWRKDAPSVVPLKYSGSNIPYYNFNTAGTWSISSVPNNHYFIQWICATNMVNTPVISIMGQASYNNYGQYAGAAWDDLNLTNLPVVELRPLYKIVYEYKSSYSNIAKSRIVYVEDVRKIDQIIGVGVGASIGPTGPTGPAGFVNYGNTGPTGIGGPTILGTLPMYYDTNSSVLYVYDGVNWKGTTLT
jgi:hypothetical protein